MPKPRNFYKPENLPNHPPPDTTANEGKDGEPPATWNPEKVEREEEVK